MEQPSTAQKRAQCLTGDVSAINSFLNRFDTFLFDCDGVIWTGDVVVPRAPEAIAMLRRKNKRIFFVTNNSTKSRSDYVSKFAKMGIPVQQSEIISSSTSAALYISKVLNLSPPRNKVFAVCESGLETELVQAGISVVGGTDPAYNHQHQHGDLDGDDGDNGDDDGDNGDDDGLQSQTEEKRVEGASASESSSDRRRRHAPLNPLSMSPELFQAIADGRLLDQNVGAVVLGLDFHINYYKICVATAYLQGRHLHYRQGQHGQDVGGQPCKLILTNTDTTLPGPNHTFFPGAGALAQAVLAAAGYPKHIAVGKPNPEMMDAIEAAIASDAAAGDPPHSPTATTIATGPLVRARTCMVGDRLNTDILFGIRSGLGGTLAVLTGVCTLDEFSDTNATTTPPTTTIGTVDNTTAVPSTNITINNNNAPKKTIIPDAYLHSLGDLAIIDAA